MDAVIALLMLVSAFTVAFAYDHYREIEKLSTEFSEELKDTLVNRMIFTLTMVALVLLVGNFMSVAGYSMNLRAQMITTLIVGFSLAFASFAESKLKVAGWL